MDVLPCIPTSFSGDNGKSLATSYVSIKFLGGYNEFERGQEVYCVVGVY